METLLPGLGAFGTFTTAVIILAKMIGHDRGQLVAADERYKQEVRDHAATQVELDQEREARRQAEDSVAGLGRKVEALTEQIVRQTERITHLEQEVSRLNGAAA
ncbi:hypothetical protein OOJ91_33865 [Micromonospora lupini]|uniref:hypothetical protein n=1 Tax=Micromonospora lupini TaxID=285679 RepID=UPI002256A28C|nr:hypothetical protein [Micromonospora lupini]MCX5070835.1 hypothetical protein [Micromonospora lupini]